MFKRITLALMLVLFAGTFTIQAANPFFSRKKAASAKLDQSSQEAVVKTVIFAVLDKDFDTVWKLMDPELLKQAQQNGMTKKDFADYMANEIDLNELAKEMEMKPADAVKLMKAFFTDDIDTIWKLMPQKEKQELIEQCGSADTAKSMFKAMLPELRKEMTKEFTKDVKMVKRNGKWYISDPDMAKKAAPKKAAVKQSTKKEAAESFGAAVANGDIDTLWQLLCPANKKAIIEESGSEAKGKAALKEAFQPDAEAKEIMANAEQKDVFVQALIDGITEKNAWVYSNGKWYIDFIKLND